MRRNFRTVGAIAPSSKRLAKAMVRHLGALPRGQLIIELGPGTGPFTHRIRQAYPDNPLLAVEFDSHLASRLQLRFPEIQVVCGCASKLLLHIQDAGYEPAQVGGVISGLPVLNLPSDIRDGVFQAVSDCLPSGRPYVQFTYSKHAWRHIHPPGFRSERSRRVFMNVPPAVVLPFLREESAVPEPLGQAV